MGVRFPSGAPAKMKKGRLLILGIAIASAFTVSGCFLFKYNSSSVVDLPTINCASSLKLNLLGYKTKKLYPELSDSSIKDPKFDFVSSNRNIATVDADGKVTAVAKGDCEVTITLQLNKSVKKTVSINVVEEPVTHYDYTIMFYMCGSDLEYNEKAKSDDENGFFSRDIQEMLSVKDMPDSVRIVIQTGGTTNWFMPSSYLEGATKISSTALQRWEINNSTNKLSLVETLSTNQMAKEDSFRDFLSWGLDNYGADQMGVVISGHGGGIAGCAYDDNYLDKDNYPYTLQTFEVAKAAKTALSNSERDKFTWIGYDCCVMQCADIATVNSDYFEYMVASQELEDAIGWNHDTYLPYLKANTHIEPEEFLPKICDAFVQETHSSVEKQACLQTLSVLDLSKTKILIDEFESVSNKLGSLVSTSVIKAKTAFEKSYNDLGDKMYGLCDFNSLLSEFKTLYSIDTTAAVNAVNSLVIYKKYCPSYSITPCGVNAFFPEYLSNQKGYALQVGREDYENKDSTRFERWQTICLAYDGFGW